jgi:carbon storage regulator
MLVLSRKVGELIQVGSDVVVRVLAVQGNRIRLGIVAPAIVPVVRGELAPVAVGPSPDGLGSGGPILDAEPFRATAKSR